MGIGMRPVRGRVRVRVLTRSINIRYIVNIKAENVPTSQLIKPKSTDSSRRVLGNSIVCLRMRRL